MNNIIHLKHKKRGRQSVTNAKKYFREFLTIFQIINQPNKKERNEIKFKKLVLSRREFILRHSETREILKKKKVEKGDLSTIFDLI